MDYWTNELFIGAAEIAINKLEVNANDGVSCRQQKLYIPRNAKDITMDSDWFGSHTHK